MRFPSNFLCACLASPYLIAHVYGMAAGVFEADFHHSEDGSEYTFAGAVSASSLFITSSVPVCFRFCSSSTSVM